MIVFNYSSKNSSVLSAASIVRNIDSEGSQRELIVNCIE